VKQQRPFEERASWRSLARRWRLLAAFLAVGLLGALVYSSLSPHGAVTHSLVLLPPAPANGGSAPTRDMGTETRIARSTPVLAKAVESTGGAVSLEQLRHEVMASAVTTSLLDIRVEDSSSRRAVALANAVARGYLGYSQELASQAADTQERVLEARATDLKRQVAGLQDEVANQTAKLSTLAPGTPAAASASAELSTSQAHLDSVARDLEDVDQAITAAKAGDAAGNTSGARLLEPATSATGPSLLTVARPFLTAALIALVAGCVVAIHADRRDDRARRRKDIAAAIGAPVVASLQARTGSEPTSHGPGAEHGESGEQQAIRALSRRFAQGDDLPTGLVVVSLRGDEAALQVVGQISDAVARSEHTRPDRGIEVVPVLTNGSELVLPRRGASMPAVMAVSAGFARRGELESVSAMMRAASRPFDGVIVTNADPRDTTSAWRTSPTDLAPTRISGVVQESDS
jgi:capsular polysaccharide biosynthesis protein